MTEERFNDPLAARRKLAGDLHRPIYHFLPPSNWMNDPNGLFYWQGRYHLFYQFNPHGPTWGFIHWGHASSSDMVHWMDHPIALRPGESAGDANGCWSGCVVDDHGVPTAVYTGFVDPAHTPVMLARARDPELLAWEKSQHNPIVKGPPEGVSQIDFRDPYVWQEDGAWKMVMGAGLENGEGGVLLYQSSDLIDWEYLGPLFTDRQLDSVQMWECPNFFPLGNRYVLLVSLFPDVLGVYYYVGEYDGRIFQPQKEGYLSQSRFFYAPQVRRLKDDRTILMGWLLEGREEEALLAAGWAGVQSLPRALSLDEDGHLVSRPIREIQSLRKDLLEIPKLNLKAGERSKLPVTGRHLEIELTLKRAEAGLRLDLLASPDGEEKTRLTLKPKSNMLELDLGNSSLSSQVENPTIAVDIPEGGPEGRSLHVFIDGSVIEAWVDDQIALTGRAFPILSASDNLTLSSLGGDLQISPMKIWRMDAIWPLAGEPSRDSTPASST
jgi:beta-fructofuranosidase